MDFISQPTCNIYRLFFACLFCLIVTCGSGSSLCQAATQDTESNTKPEVDYQLKSAKETLAANRIPPTADGIRLALELLDPQHPKNLELAKQVDKLIDQLGSPEYLVRENASSRLKSMINLPMAALAKASRSPQPEVAYRAKFILKFGETRDPQKTSVQVIKSACQVIVSKQIRGLFVVLMNALENFPEAWTNQIVQKALVTTAEKTDEARLRNAMKSEKHLLRSAGTLTLLALLESQVNEELKQFLKEEQDERVRIELARAFANRGQRHSVPTLVELLNAQDVNIRVQANQTIKSLTGQRFGFVAYSKLKEREAKIKQWRDWVSESLPKAELNFPLTNSALSVGRILYADYKLAEIVEVDLNGKELWRKKDITGAWNTQGLPNGHRLASSYLDGSVVEFDTKGKQVWKITTMNSAMGMHQIANGNTLVGHSTKVAEYNREGKEVWSAQVSGRVSDCQRLENGNTLVALFDTGKVIEVDDKGKIVWNLKTERQPMSVQRTASGTTLVASLASPLVQEFDSKKNVVWELKLNETNTVARRLPNGDTMICGKTNIKMLERDKSIRWEIKDLKHAFGLSAY